MHSIANNKSDAASSERKTEDANGLVGVERCRELVFPDPDSRPCRRIWDEWRAKGLLPFRKIGRRVFMDPEEVRRAIDHQFKVEVKKY